MAFFSVLVALIFEQFHSLSRNNPIYTFLRRAVDSAEKNLNSGSVQDGKIAWCLLVFPLAFLVGFIHYLLLDTHPIWAFIWNAAVVYFTLGFRQFSHYFTNIHKALLINDLSSAREILQTWTKLNTDEMSAQEIVRLTLERAIIAAHRHVFGVFFCFLLPIGPAGVVIYRMAEYIARRWSNTEESDNQAFGLFASRVFQKIDWLPARLTALGFAIVGNFEDAIQAWRQNTQHGSKLTENILLDSASGALGVHLGILTPENNTNFSLDQESISVVGMGEAASIQALQSAVGLVWRAMVLWMILLALLSMARLLGG